MKEEVNVEIPMGFGMALAQNPRAMAYFSRLTDKEKQSIIDGTHSLQSKSEMQDYVDHLGNEK